MDEKNLVKLINKFKLISFDAIAIIESEKDSLEGINSMDKNGNIQEDLQVIWSLLNTTEKYFMNGANLFNEALTRKKGILNNINVETKNNIKSDNTTKEEIDVPIIKEEKSVEKEDIKDDKIEKDTSEENDKVDNIDTNTNENIEKSEEVSVEESKQDVTNTEEVKEENVVEESTPVPTIVENNEPIEENNENVENSVEETTNQEISETTEENTISNEETVVTETPVTENTVEEEVAPTQEITPVAPINPEIVTENETPSQDMPLNNLPDIETGENNAAQTPETENQEVVAENQELPQQPLTPSEPINIENQETEPVINQETQVIQDAGPSPEENTSVTEQVQDNNTTLQPQNTDIIPPTTEAVQTEMPTPEIAPQETTTNQVIASPEAANQTTIPLAPQTTDDVPLTPDTSIQNTTPQEKIIFNKQSNTPDKAILVTQNQGLNLRGSKEVQKALFNSLPSNTNDLPQQSATSSQEKQIEEMLAQIPILYEQGRTAEAQAMSEKVSVLSKSLLPNNNK